jgi:hypothetical protein
MPCISGGVGREGNPDASGGSGLEEERQAVLGVGLACFLVPAQTDSRLGHALTGTLVQTIGPTVRYLDHCN